MILMNLKKKHVINRIVKTILVLLLTNFLFGCDMVLMNPKGAIGLEQKKIIIFSFCLMSLIIIPVIIMTLLFSIKYRSNRNSNYNPDLDKSKIIEFFCWLFPILIIFVLSIVAYRTTYQLDPYKTIDNKKESVKIQVISSNWKWVFIYPKQKIAAVNELFLPLNIPIEFNLTSSSVMNSFFIPSLGSQIYTMPGMETRLNLIANYTGIYKGFSSNYSGEGFSDMKFNVIVGEKSEFEDWIKKVKFSEKKINHISDILKTDRFSRNISNYYSEVKENIYEEIISMCNGSSKRS
ncbi:hypothetical protein AOQ88_00510 [Candidatus Riesia sp. GBBU]|nr:hypothetical protein AOQ88_00510 [Candidatus Riesia sp. GBBU]